MRHHGAGSGRRAHEHGDCRGGRSRGDGARDAPRSSGRASRLPGREDAGPGGRGPELSHSRHARLTVTPARRVALSLLREVDRGRRLDLVWESAAPDLSPVNRAWVHELLFGVFRLRGRIDHLLGLHLHRGVGSLPLPLLQVLRLGAYQLVGMGSVPDYAAVSQSVSQARDDAGAKGAGVANAVLRALGQAGGDVDRFPSFERDPVEHLVTWGSHPRWLVERWVERFGAAAAGAVVEAGNRVPHLFLRPIGVPLTHAADQLAAAGIPSEDGPPGTATLRLPPGTDPVAALGAVPSIIQDPAASSVAELVGASQGDRVLDLCAAPGGKGIALMGLGARVFATDPSRTRLLRMRQALHRLGLPVRIAVGRAEAPPFAPADVVLVDVPCTGTATLARHPDTRWRLGPDAPAHLASIQAQILAGAASAVRPGGLLVYATCTLEAEENEGAIQAFLGHHPDFAPEGETAILQVFPGTMSTDGAFAARLRRAR
ncbi:MAG: hypothetical protein EXR92_01485 [Gemmatimonadetes bacterium]|nr:hypothetical protein [Gemmatimonadota bacterium]